MGSKLVEESGTIHCYGCSEVLGKWNWKRWSHCKCGKKVKGAFGIEQDKIILIQKPKLALGGGSSSSLLSAGSLSPRSKERKNRSIGGLLSRKKLMRLNPAKSETNMLSGKRDHRPSGEHPPVFATCFEELDKDLKRYVTKNKIPPQEINDNWYVATQVYRFSAKVRVIALPVSERLLESSQATINKRE